MSNTKEASFGPIRSFFWPIHRYEMKKFLPMLAIFFLISFNYNVLRTLKDPVVVTAKESGAEVIPFIKVWVMFPMSILMTFIFTRLANRFQFERVFYLMLSIFLTYYLLFVFILYPNRDALHPHDFAHRMQLVLPHGFKGMIAMVQYWTFTSFYAMSELWGNIILFLLFWGFANRITKVQEAKRFYGLFGIGANISGVAAGQASIFLTQYARENPFNLAIDTWEQSLIILISAVAISGICTMFLFRYLNKLVQQDRIEESTSVSSNKKKKPKLSMRENFSYVAKSKYLLCIAAIVLSYNLVINLVEVLWKHQVRELYPSPLDYNLYMNQITTITGVLATFMSLCVAGNSIRKFGWTFTALITPTILLITSIGFFSFYFSKHHLSSDVLISLGTSPLAIVVFFGSAQNCLSRACKYTVFDATKELSFVPLTEESQLKGKAAIDGVGTRLGKSGGSLIYQGLLITFSTLTACAPYVAFFLFTAISAWIFATRSLGRQFKQLTEKEREETAIA